MSRYIDADALSEYVEKQYMGFIGNPTWDDINSAPSIDIVRCSECKWYGNEQKKIYECCTYWAQNGGMLVPMNPDDFCSYGERSGKPNNSTISKMEQVETMSCAECKHRPIGAEICEEPCHYEPQTDWHYDDQDATWYPYKHEDEPQTERSSE